MIERKKVKKKGFDPKKSELKRVLRHIVRMLESGEAEKIANEARKFSNRHYRKLYRGDPSTWHFYSGREWLCYGIKKVLNVKAERPISKYRSGLLTLHDLRELAELVGINYVDLGDINRSIWWQKIVAKVKQDEDSLINRLKKLWAWLEDRIDVTDADYLIVNAPGFWKDRESYKDPDWRAKHLTYMFDISYMIQEIVDAKLKVERSAPVVTGLSKLQLWVITHEIMGLEEVPHSATKEVMWQSILQKIESDKIKPSQ